MLSPRFQRTNRLRIFTTVIAPLALLLAGTPPAAASTEYSFNPTGAVFVCRDAAYTVTGGRVILVGQGSDPSPDPIGPFTEVPQGVTLTDARSATVYSLQGALRVTEDSSQSPATSVGNGLFVAHLNIVAPGRGIVDRVSLTIHIDGTGRQFVLDRSTCEIPAG